MNDTTHLSFDDLHTPLLLGSMYYEPNVESVKKLAYAVEDESGWLVGDPNDQLINPHFLSAYQWWPSGFYHREPGARGIFTMFQERYPHLIESPFLHAKAVGRFFSPFKAGGRVRADVSVIETYRRRGRGYIVLRASFFDPNETLLAEFDNTVAIRKDHDAQEAETGRQGKRQIEVESESKGEALPERVIHMSLEKSRMFTLPTENYHTHDEAAQARGFRVAMPAAMMCFGYFSKHAESYFGRTWFSTGEVSATFVRMFPRDAILTVSGRVTGRAETASGTRVELTLQVRDAEGQTIAAGKASALTA